MIQQEQQKERYFRQYIGQRVLNRFGWPGLLVNAPVKENQFWLYNTFLELEHIEPFEHLSVSDLLQLGWVKPVS